MSFIISKPCDQINSFFCFVCGKYHKSSLNYDLSKTSNKEKFKKVFKCYPKNLSESWSASSICRHCIDILKEYKKNLEKNPNTQLPLLPTIWRQPKQDHSDCYICNFKFHEFRRDDQSFMSYPEARFCSIVLSKDRDEELRQKSTSNLQSTSNLHDPNPFDLQSTSNLNDPNPFDLSSSFDESLNLNEFSCSSPKRLKIDPDYQLPSNQRIKEPDLFDAPSLRDMFREVNLTKEQSLLIASALKRRNLVKDDVRVEFFNHREAEVLPFLREHNSTPYVYDYEGLFNYFGVVYNPSDWRLSIDGNTIGKTSNLKCCLLYHGPDDEDRELLPCVPILVSTKHKEIYEDLVEVMELIDYKKHNWLICCDLKMVNLLCGLGNHASSLCCFLCKWVSTAREDHYDKEYEPRTGYVLGFEGVRKTALVEMKNIILPPLHILIGLYYSFAKQLFQVNESALEYIMSKYPFISPSKHKNGVLTGNLINQLMEDNTFAQFLTEDQLNLWQSICAFSKELLSARIRPENYMELANNLKDSFARLGTNMSPKVHLATQHPSEFRQFCAKYSEQPGERMHQDLKPMQERYHSSGWGLSFLADYLYNLRRETVSKSRKSRRTSFPPTSRTS